MVPSFRSSLRHPQIPDARAFLLKPGGLIVIVAPISFVSEHSETLVELDRDYCRLAESCGVPVYRRVATVGTDRRFINALAELVRGAERTAISVENAGVLSGTAS